MRIIEADVWEVITAEPGRQPNRYRPAASSARVIVRVQGDSGHEGWGESVPLEYFTGETASVSASLLREAAGRLKGKDLKDPVSAIDGLADFSRQCAARAALEIALLDLEGKILGRPMSHWLGGENRSEIFSYGAIGLLSPEDAAKRAQKFLDRGILTFKIKVGGNWEEDAERVRAVRKASPDDASIRIDANGGYRPEEAMRLCEKVREAGIQHFEQPVRPDDPSAIEVFRRIRKMGIPVAADESLFSAEDARRLIEEEAVDVGVIKLIKFGGPLRAQKVCATLESAGKRAVLSASHDSFIGKAAGLALALSLCYGDLAHEFSEFPGEAEFASWRHQYREGRFIRGAAAGHGAWGIRDRLARLADPAGAPQM